MFDKHASKQVAKHFNFPNHFLAAYGSLRPFPTCRHFGKPQNSRTELYLSNRHSLSPRYQRTFFIQLALTNDRCSVSNFQVICWSNF